MRPERTGIWHLYYLSAIENVFPRLYVVLEELLHVVEAMFVIFEQ